MSRMLRIAFLLAALAACGGDGGTAPPTDVNLTGTWTVTISPIRGYGVDCQTLVMEAQLVHTGTDLTGSYTIQDWVCNGQHSGPMAGSIVSGTAINGQLHFHLDVEDWDLHGTVRSADLASGSYTLVLNVEGRVYSFRGTWSARRQ